MGRKATALTPGQKRKQLHKQKTKSESVNTRGVSKKDIWMFMRESEWLGGINCHNTRLYLIKCFESRVKEAGLSLCVREDQRIIDHSQRPPQVILDALRDPSIVYVLFADFKDGLVQYQNLNIHVGSMKASGIEVTQVGMFLSKFWHCHILFVRGDTTFTSLYSDCFEVLRQVCTMFDYSPGAEGGSMVCQVCFESYDYSAYLFKCNHLFCQGCSIKLCKDNNPKCPICRNTKLYEMTRMMNKKASRE